MITARFDPSVDLADMLTALGAQLGTVAGNAEITVQEQAQGDGGGSGNVLEVIVQGNDYGQVS
jgi:hypothetical protein